MELDSLTQLELPCEWIQDLPGNGKIRDNLGLGGLLHETVEHEGPEHSKCGGHGRHGRILCQDLLVPSNADVVFLW